MADTQLHYDLVTIGSGAAAFAAAIEARQLGARVAMIERGTVGGTCVNVGCVPSKALLRATAIYQQARTHPFAGLETHAGNIDLRALISQKDRLTSEMRRDKYEALIDEYGWDLIRGEARFIDRNTLRVADQLVSADSIVLATGTSPGIPTIAGLSKIHYLTSESAMEVDEVPGRLLIIGTGYVGMEQGQIFRNLGSDVTLLQRSDHLLPSYEPDVSDVVARELTRQGFVLRTGSRVERIERSGNGYRVIVNRDNERDTIEVDAILVATGRQPNINALDLPRAGVKLDDRRAPHVDGYLRTSNPRVWAAGDVTLAPQFVYVAAYQGRLAARNALNGPAEAVDHRFVPSVIFTEPQVAAVGLTRRQAEQAGYTIKSTVISIDAIPRALVDFQADGVITMVAEAETDSILGVQIVGGNAGEVIYAATLAVQYGMTVPDLVDSFAPYLTMAEGLKLGAISFTREVSKLSCCAA